MRVSEWVKTLNPLGVMWQDKTESDFIRCVGKRAEWPIHYWSEVCDKVRAEPDHSAAAKKPGRPAGLAVADYDPNSRHAYAYEIAQSLCIKFTGEDPAQNIEGRGSAWKMDVWSRSIEILERASL